MTYDLSREIDRGRFRLRAETLLSRGSLAVLEEKVPRTTGQNAYEQAKLNSEHMRQMTKKLQADIQEAESKIGELKAKLRIAESKEKMQQLGEKIGGKSALGNFDSLADSVQKRIDAADAKEALNAELSGDMGMSDLEKKYAGAAGGTSSAQSELEALKARMGGETPVESSDAAAQLAAMKAQMNEGSV